MEENKLKKRAEEGPLMDGTESMLHGVNAAAQQNMGNANGEPGPQKEASGHKYLESTAMKVLGLLGICALVTGEVFDLGALWFGAAYWNTDQQLSDFFAFANFGHAYMVPLVFACIVGFVLMIALIIFELMAAGHRKDGQVHLTWIDKIPFDLFTFLALTLISIYFVMDVEYGILPPYVGDGIITNLWAAAALLDVGALLIAIYFLSLARRVKAHAFLKNNIIFWICHGIKKFFIFLGSLIPNFWKRMLILAFFAIVQIVLLMFYREYGWSVGADIHPLIFWLFFLLALALVLWSWWMQKVCFEEAEAIRAGDLSKKIPEDKLKYMTGSLKAHAEDLNFIRDGVEDAVNVRLKSEHLKTELITNVSHDIKTPLTSIISYVDLLSKDHTEEEEKQYIDVLKRQTERLRKLTEDVLEASKADSGNVEVHLEKTSAAEIVEQALGEYEEKLKAANLETVVNVPEGLYVTADGKLLWRVLRNLLSNAAKYSAPGSRVYITAVPVGVSTGNGQAAGGSTQTEGSACMAGAGQPIGTAQAAGGAHAAGTSTGVSVGSSFATIEIKNVSKDMLNVSADELMERFIRGDASRHTEGSGLGLDIAKSLTTLMGGTFEIAIDGDLFKAIIRLPQV